MADVTVRVSEIVIGVGTTVTLVDVDGKNEPVRFTLVASGESNPSKGKVSVDTPLGRAVTGRRRGEEVTTVTRGGGRHPRIAYVQR